MRLIVGLGNPGIEYAWTPHNLGFLVVDKLAEQAGIRVTRPESKSYVGLGSIAGHEVALAKPQTMMNLSGIAVRELLDRTECEPADLIVIFDDIALPWGYIRIKERGSSGGHKGVESIIMTLGDDNFVRVRVGISPLRPVRDLASYVLTRIPERGEIKEEAEIGITTAAEAVEKILRDGPMFAMAAYNKKVPLN